MEEIYGIIFKHDGGVSLWEQFGLSKDETEIIMQILEPHINEGESIFAKTLKQIFEEYNIPNVILRHDRYALIDRGYEYVVACGFNGKEYNQGYYYTHWNESEIKKAECLCEATDRFYSLVNDTHISRRRLEELATKFKDGFLEMSAELNYMYDAAEEYMYDNDFELAESEKEWFGIETEMEEL